MSEREPDRDRQPRAADNRDGQRILIIDDEAGIRDSLETLLTLEGFTRGDGR
jgi:PleD family two-component response regulator